MVQEPRAIILLCAGCGSRMGALTERIPKCLLPVGERLVIDYLIDAIIARSNGEIVAVIGFEAARVRQHVAARYGGRVTTAYNAKFDEDVNILSLETGVSALRHPERGYLVVEADLLLEDAAWDRVFAAADAQDSFWLCKGYYNDKLTGGIVHANDQGCVDAVEYQPNYDVRFEGWPKMLGILGVSPAQVRADRLFRQAAIAETMSQYYLMPWRQHLDELSCGLLQIDDYFGQTFNTASDFAQARKRYLDLLGIARALTHH